MTKLIWDMRNYQQKIVLISLGFSAFLPKIITMKNSSHVKT